MSITPVLVLDFDGTLVDTLPRHYAVYCLISDTLKTTPLPYLTYCQFRREGLNNIEVLLHQGLKRSDQKMAESLWLEKIESLEMLRIDRLFPRVKNWLHEISQTYKLVLVTLRNAPELLKKQLDWLGLSDYFQQILILNHQSNAALTKKKAVKEGVQGKILAWIGDTEVDMEAAKKLKVRPIGVTSGMRKAEKLITAGAGEIFESVSHIRLWRQ